MEEWKIVEIKDICTGIFEGPHATPKESQTGGIYLGIPAINVDGHINYDNAKRIAEEDLPQWTKRVTPQEDDIVFTNEATLNLYAIIPAGFHGCLGRRLGLIRLNKDLVNVRYLFYYFFSPEWRETISRNKVSGATVERILMTKFPHFPVKLPPLHIQNKIAMILSSIDDKIALNNRINHNLEEQAQALYKSWFVDFEPFKNGKFVDSELGLIPEEWRVATLGEVTSEMRDKVGTRQDVKVLSPVTTGQLVLSEEFFRKQVFSESIAKYLIVRPNDFAYNPARVNIGSLGKNEFDFDGCVSPVYVVFRCETGYEHFFNLYRSSNTFKEEVISRSNGGVRQTLGYKDFALIKLVYPPVSVVEEFNAIYCHMLMGIRQRKEESIVLANQRDELLPNLMTGKIPFDDLTC